MSGIYSANIVCSLYFLLVAARIRKKKVFLKMAKHVTQNDLCCIASTQQEAGR